MEEFEHCWPTNRSFGGDEPVPAPRVLTEGQKYRIVEYCDEEAGGFFRQVETSDGIDGLGAPRWKGISSSLPWSALGALAEMADTLAQWAAREERSLAERAEAMMRAPRPSVSHEPERAGELRSVDFPLGGENSCKEEFEPFVVCSAQVHPRWRIVEYFDEELFLRRRCLEVATAEDAMGAQGWKKVEVRDAARDIFSSVVNYLAESHRCLANAKTSEVPRSTDA